MVLFASTHTLLASLQWHLMYVAVVENIADVFSSHCVLRVETHEGKQSCILLHPVLLECNQVGQEKLFMSSMPYLCCLCSLDHVYSDVLTTLQCTECEYGVHMVRLLIKDHAMKKSKKMHLGFKVRFYTS